MSMPLSTCCLTRSLTASAISRSSASASYGRSNSRSFMMSSSECGLARLPTWVVRMRSVLCFMVPLKVRYAHGLLHTLPETRPVDSASTGALPTEQVGGVQQFRAFGQLGRRSAVPNSAALQHVCRVGERKGHVGELFDQQDRHTGGGDVGQRRHQTLDDDGSQAE